MKKQLAAGALFVLAACAEPLVTEAPLLEPGGNLLDVKAAAKPEQTIVMSSGAPCYTRVEWTNLPGNVGSLRHLVRLPDGFGFTQYFVSPYIPIDGRSKKSGSSEFFWPSEWFEDDTPIGPGRVELQAKNGTRLGETDDFAIDFECEFEG